MATERLDLEADSSSILRAAVDLDRLEDAARKAGLSMQQMGYFGREADTAAEALRREIDLNVALLRQEMAALDGAAAAQDRMNRGVGAGTQQMHSMRFATANIAAQLQDIAVTSAMGMNPLTIALQQGTQLSAVFSMNQGGLGGVVKDLGAAFLSVVSPISLVTIGLVAVTSAAVQLIAQNIRLGETADQAFDRYGKRIGEIIDGYEHATEIVKDWQDAARADPSEVVVSNLQKAFADANRELEQFQRKNANTSGQFLLLGGVGDEANAAIVRMREMMALFGRGEMSASDLQIEMTKIANTDFGFINGAISDMARSFADGADKAGALYDLYVALQHAAAAAGESAGTQFGLDNYVEAQRSAEAHQLELDAIYAKTPAQIADIARRREALDLRDKEMTESLRQQKIDEAGAEAYTQLAYQISEAERMRLLSARQASEAGQLQLDTLGKSIAETQELTFVRQRMVEAETVAAETGIATSQAYIDRIYELGEAFGELQQRVAEQQAMHDLLFEQSQFVRSSYEQEIASSLREIYGDDFQDQMNGFIATQMRVNQTLEEFDTTGQAVTSNFLSTFRDQLVETRDLAGSFASAVGSAIDSIADKLLSYASEGLWDMLFGLGQNILFGGGFGGFGGGVNPSTGLPGLFADGAAFPSAPGLGAYRNTIVTQPTLFPFARGVGLMGEEPGSPGEAIMPLVRNAQGRLAVHAAGGESRGSGGGLESVRLEIAGVFGEQAMYEAARRGAREVLDEYRAETFHDDWERHSNDPRARGAA